MLTFIANQVEFWDNLAKLMILTLIGVGIGLVKWLNACYSYAKNTIGVSGLNNAGYTTWGWVIPIYNLFKPYQVISEIYKVGAPNYTGAEGWKQESGSGALLAWWIFWAVTHLVMWMMFRMTMSSTFGENATMRGAIMATEVQAWTCVVSLAVAGLWFWVANLLTQRLLDRNPVSANSFPSEATYQTPEPARTGPETMGCDWQPRSDKTPEEEKLSNQLPDVDENAIYARIANELETRSEDRGLWTRLFADSDGDEKKTKVLYIKHRAAQLTAAEQSRIGALTNQAREAAKTKEQQEAKQRAQHEAMERKVRETAERFGITPDVAAAVLRHGIVKDGARFRYREFFYDRIADAIAYADLDAGRRNKPLWAPKPQPQAVQRHVEEKSPALGTRFTLADVAEKARIEGVSTEDAESMLRFNIKKEGGRYVYQTYRYDKLADAINYAKCDVGRVAK